MQIEEATMQIDTRLMKLKQGEEQIIKVKRREMLCKAMHVLGSSSPPVFTEIDCGTEGSKLSVRLDLTYGDQVCIDIVEGDPFSSIDAAEDSVVNKAFAHIEERCHVRILDYSSRVARGFEWYNTYAYVNEAMGAVDKIINNFDACLSKWKEVAIELHMKECGARKNANQTAEGKVYGDLSEYLTDVTKSFSATSFTSRSRLNEIEFDRMKHHKSATERAKRHANKCYTRKVVFSAKYLLDYVLNYFGFAKASYTNGPRHDGRVKGAVQFVIPYIDKLKFCGTLTIKGNGENSVSAEETAAYEALKLIEENFKVQIVDLNVADREEAAAVQKMLVKMTEQIIEVGEAVKNAWVKMQETMTDQSEHYSYEAGSACNKDMAREVITAYQYCSEEIQRVQQESSECYDSCWTQFHGLEKVMCKLNTMKIRLGIM